MNNIYDTVILGGGPGGVSAGVYAARKKMQTALITQSFGGQSVVSATVENWIGETSIKGTDLKNKLEEHIRFFEKSGDITILQPSKVVKIKKDTNFILTTDRDEELVSRTLIIATGARHRHLNVEGENKFSGRGVVYCSTCDAPMFRNKKVVVIGTGNSGLEAVEDLLPYALEIKLLGNRGEITVDALTWERIKTQKNDIEVIYNAEVTEIIGETLVSGLRYTDKLTGQNHFLEVEGVFVEIGSVPNSDLLKGLVELNDYGQIIINAARGTTSDPAIFAAGDVTDVPFKQNNIAAGDAIKATLSAYEYLKQNQ